MVLFALLAALSFFLLFGIGFWLLFKVFNINKPIRAAILTSVLYLALFFLGNTATVHWLSFFTHFLLGALLYTSIAAILYLILHKYLPRQTLALRIAFVFLIVSVLTIASLQFQHIEVERISLSSDKITEPLSFVHITDTQLGSTSTRHFEKAWRTTFEQEVDFIVFTGDLIDYDHYHADQFAILEESPVPIYFIRGNHEFMHNTFRLNSIIQNISTLHILENEKIQVEGIDIIGVEYNNQLNYLASQLQKINTTTNYTLLLYHEPINPEIATAHGVELMLSGHTHAGQLWPLTIVTKLVYPYANGECTFGNMTLYTSDGAGLWGPNMRLGTQNEIVVFTLNPQN